MSLLFEILAGISFGSLFVLVYLAVKLVSVVHDYAQKVDGLQLTLPVKKHMELSELFGQLKSEFDTVLVGQDEFREKIYRQIQRFDTIMRRNERAVAAVAEDDGVEVALPQIGEKPVELPVVAASAAGTTTNESNVDKQRRLRELWHKSRSIE